MRFHTIPFNFTNNKKADFIGIYKLLFE